MFPNERDIANEGELRSESRVFPNVLDNICAQWHYVSCRGPSNFTPTLILNTMR